MVRGPRLALGLWNPPLDYILQNVRLKAPADRVGITLDLLNPGASKSPESRARDSGRLVWILALPSVPLLDRNGPSTHLAGGGEGGVNPGKEMGALRRREQVVGRTTGSESCSGQRGGVESCSFSLPIPWSRPWWNFSTSLKVTGLSIPAFISTCISWTHKVQAGSAANARPGTVSGWSLYFSREQSATTYLQAPEGESSRGWCSPAWEAMLGALQVEGDRRRISPSDTDSPAGPAVSKGLERGFPEQGKTSLRPNRKLSSSCYVRRPGIKFYPMGLL